MPDETQVSMAGEKVIETLNPPDGGDDKPIEGVKIDDIEAGASSIPDMSHGEDSELVSTLDGGGEEDPPIVDDKGAEVKPEEKGSEEDKGGELGEEKELSGEEGRYDKIPRFKEIETERNANLERALKAEARIEALEGQKPVEEEKDYTDITSMEDAALREWQERDLKGYAANQGKQILAEVREIIKEELKADTYQDGVNKTHLEYTKENADFVPMMNDGRIADFINSNPGHNAISAHMALTSDSREKAINDGVQAKVDEAVKKTKEEMTKDQLVKRANIPAGAHTGGAVPLTSSSEGDQILKDSKKAGGKTMALVRKLKFDRAKRNATG